MHLAGANEGAAQANVSGRSGAVGIVSVPGWDRGRRQPRSVSDSAMTAPVGTGAAARVTGAAPVAAATPVATATPVAAAIPVATTEVAGMSVEAGSATPVATAISVAAPTTAEAEVGTGADRTVVARGNAAGDDGCRQTDPDVQATGLGGGGIEAGANANHGGKGQSC